MSSSLKAWTHYTPPFPSTLQQVPIEVPSVEALGKDQLVVEVSCAALNPLDIQLANLGLFRLPQLHALRGLGRDFSGTVLASSNARFRPGDDVFGVALDPLGGPTKGTLSHVCVVDLARSAVAHKPRHLDFSTAAAVPLAFLTAKTCLSPPYLQLDDLDDQDEKPTIVVLGGSTAVGTFVVQYARVVLGLSVVATASRRNVEFVESLGATTVIEYDDNSTTTSRNSVLDRLVAERPRNGYCSIIDCVGGTELVSNLSDLVTPRQSGRGRRGVGGSYTTIVGDKPSTARDRLGGSVTTWWTPRQALQSWLGWFGWGPRYYCISLDTTHPEWLDEVAEMTRPPLPPPSTPRRSRIGGDEEEGAPARGGKHLRVVIDEEFGFDEVPKAFEKLSSGKATGKIVVNVKKVK